MIKNLINSNLLDLSTPGFDIHIIKKYDNSYQVEPFITENLAVLMIRSGGVKIKLQEMIQNLSARDLIVIPKETTFTVFEVRNKLQLYLIIFSSEFAVKNCLKRELVDSFYLFIRKEPLKASLEEKEYQVLSLIYKLIHYINLEVQRTDIDYELYRISLNLFLYELKLIYAKYSSNALVNFTRKENLVIQFLTILSIHYKKQHHAKFYAGELFITSKYLSKVVKEVTGSSVKALIIEAIISEAKILLEDTQNTFAEIAEEMEFASVSIFGIFFKKHTSYSPSEYRAIYIDRYKDQ
ncbi:helix-turn-helix domain-containing protein [Flavobacterium sp. 17A]|uniref:Helix-turn-helix domain-containing protein n=1 Tax=Flavobacterium potami TaxID=2872310 RepID=A0A9X1KQ68_9FLAO|nr:helix-turn-helix domain-containing protein [Flavobacterium potami]MBZ4033831.1 helix-turn-helix domain-containing protein [Flavobacterium potami]